MMSDNATATKEIYFEETSAARATGMGRNELFRSQGK
jgi:hypothetical protein